MYQWIDLGLVLNLNLLRFVWLFWDCYWNCCLMMLDYSYYCLDFIVVFGQMRKVDGCSCFVYYWNYVDFQKMKKMIFLVQCFV